MVCKILVIDDSLSIHTLVKTHLCAQRIEVLSSYDGATGLVAAAQVQPDLILLDVDMPDLQGYEVCRRLKAAASTRAIPVLFLTAARKINNKIQGLDVGACDYITKPFDPDELRARVRSALRTKGTIDELARNSVMDPITGLFDRKYFDGRLDAALSAVRRSGRTLGLILVDIDRMGVTNSASGYVAGDDLLHAAAQAIQQACRREDVVCRFGGDEFAVLTSDADVDIVADVAERIRVAIGSAKLVYPDKTLHVTVSIGTALSHFSAGSSIVREAEHALSTAKQAGGNCVRVGAELLELRVAG